MLSPCDSAYETENAAQHATTLPFLARSISNEHHTAVLAT